MATRVYNGSTNNWSSTAAWAGGVVPTAADDVLIGTGTGGSTTGTLTIDGTSASPNLCRSIDCTSFTGTVTAGSTGYLKVGDGTAGAFKLVSGMTFTTNVATTIEFASTTSGNNITAGSKSLPTVLFSGVGGSWQLQDTMNWGGGGGSVTLTNGTLDLNGKTVTFTGTFSSSNTNTRALTCGAASISMGSNNWDITTSTGMTLSAASATITSTQTSGTQTFNFGGLTYGTVSCTTLTTGNITITGNNTFSTLTLSTGAGVSSAYILGGNQTISGTFTSNGNSIINRAYFKSTVRGTQRTISAATVTVTNIDLEDIVGAGAGSWNLAAITGLSGDCGNNSGITFTTPTTVYWVPSGATSTGSESAVTRWATSDGGTAGTGRSPLPQDTAKFTANSIDAGSRTITQDKPRIGTHDWTGATNTPAWTKTQVTSFYGDIKMVASMTNSGTSAYTYKGTGTGTYTTAAVSITNALGVDAGTGTLVLADAYTSTSTLTITSGTLDSLTNSVAVSITTAAYNGGTFNLGGTVTGSNNFTLNGGTYNNSTFATTCAAVIISSGTISGTGNITGSGALSFTTSGTANSLNNTLSATTMAINGTGTWNVKNISLSSTISSTQAGNVVHTGTITVGNNGTITPGGGGGYSRGRVVNAT